MSSFYAFINHVRNSKRKKKEKKSTRAAHWYTISYPRTAISPRTQRAVPVNTRPRDKLSGFQMIWMCKFGAHVGSTAFL
jgi:hypothetical protein